MFIGGISIGAILAASFLLLAVSNALLLPRTTGPHWSPGHSGAPRHPWASRPAGRSRAPGFYGFHRRDWIPGPCRTNRSRGYCWPYGASGLAGPARADRSHRTYRATGRSRAPGSYGFYRRNWVPGPCRTNRRLRQHRAYRCPGANWAYGAARTYRPHGANRNRAA